MGGSASGCGDGGDPAAGGDVEHSGAADQGGVVEQVSRQGLATGPGEGPEWWFIDVRTVARWV